MPLSRDPGGFLRRNYRDCMMVARMQRCKSVTAYHVHELVQRAMRRPRAQLPDSSPLVTGDDGASVRFFLEWSNQLITGVRYRSSTCATLLAYCEVACDLIAGMSREDLAALSASDLEVMLPEVPAARRSRSELVVRAIQSAIAVSVQ